MSKIFNNKANEKPMSQREMLEQKYNRSVSNLLLVIIFSVINIVLLVTNSDRYFLFSAFVPYILANYGMYFSGMFPEEYYYDMPETEFLGTSFLIAMIAVAAVIILLYFSVGFLLKRRKSVG